MDNTADNFVSGLHGWHSKALGEKTAESLRKNNFRAEYLELPEEARNRILSQINPGDRIAFGGSYTVKQLGLPELIEKIPAVILDHNAPGLDAAQKLDIMLQQQVCDVFICSANAITLDGHIFNVDGTCNRISAMVFGPKKVIVVAGVNKICQDEAAAWERIRMIAAPVNMKRLNRRTPCTVTGYCTDCDSPERGCNAYLVLKKKPALADFSVFIVNKSLGF